VRKVRCGVVLTPKQISKREAKKPVIVGIIIRYVADYDVDFIDTSYGTFSAEVNEDNKNRGSAFLVEQNSSGARYFTCEYKVEERRETLIAKGYSNGRAEEEARRQCKKAYERVLAFGNEEWGYIGIVAETRCECSHGFQKNFTSMAIWGIESDDDVGIKENAEDQIAQLKCVLEKEGISIRNFERLSKLALDKEVFVENEY